MWTIEQGIEIARRVEIIAIKEGFHAALGGSVLHAGESQKDLDVFVYPHKTSETTRAAFDGLCEALYESGFSHLEEKDHKIYGDSKRVYTSELEGKRVDFFFVQ